MSYRWKSVEDRQLETLQKIHEVLYCIKNHQEKISSAQVTEMSVLISILGKLLVKVENLEKQSMNNGKFICNNHDTLKSIYELQTRTNVDYTKSETYKNRGRSNF